MTTIVSWNVNGLRAALKKNFLSAINELPWDFLCLQETRTLPEQVELPFPKAQQLWNPAAKLGYSGTLILSRVLPLSVSFGMASGCTDDEGRVLSAEFDEFYLVNVYVPNAQRELKRLDFRCQQWDLALRRYLTTLRKKKPVVCCGDFNVAHQEIDLANPKSNRRNAGFTAEERRGFGDLLDSGFCDTFRLFEPGPGHYTWWSPRNQARQRNIGWRIDYCLASADLKDSVLSSHIYPNVLGSDHCPVALRLRL